jgi:PIN domain nuclease of toxin-antitoxin system
VAPSLAIFASPSKPDRRFAEQLANPRNEILLSAAVVWEVAIKRSLGKLEAPDDLAPTLLGAGAVALPVSLEHAAAFERLPWHHRDPFDRLLIAQAAREGAVLVSGDEALRPYGVPALW